MATQLIATEMLNEDLLELLLDYTTGPREHWMKHFNHIMIEILLNLNFTTNGGKLFYRQNAKDIINMSKAMISAFGLPNLKFLLVASGCKIIVKVLITTSMTASEIWNELNQCQMIANINCALAGPIQYPDELPGETEKTVHFSITNYAW